MRPEAEFAIALCRHAISIPTLLPSNAEVDWIRFESYLYHHGLAPLVLKSVEQNPTAILPEELKKKLKGRQARTALRNLRMTGELIRILRALDAVTVGVAFKGPVLAARAYENVAMREFGDLDVLVSRAALGDVRRVLGQLGYQADPPFTRREELAYEQASCERSFISQDGHVSLDLHWQFTSTAFPFAYDYATLASRVMEVTVGGQLVRSLDDEDMFLILAVHGAKHRWDRLEWLATLGALVQRRQLDWSLIERRAAQYRIQRTSALARALLADVMGVETGGQTVRRLSAIEPLLDEVAAGFMSRNLPAPSTSAELNWFVARLADRPSEGAAAVLHSVFVPTIPDWKAVAISPRFSWLYYLVRLVRLSLLSCQSLLMRLRLLIRKALHLSSD